MSDPTRLVDRLEQLAPSVDAAAGRDLFDQRRSGGGAPRWLLPAAVIVLVVAGVVGVWAVNRGDGSAPVAGPGTSIVTGPLTEGSGYETVFVGQVSRAFGDARLAATIDGYEAAWSELGTGGDAPSVDLERNAVLVMTRPDNACADTIVRVEIDHEAALPTWTPVFEDLSSACEDPLLSWVYVVALDRALLSGRRTIRVPAAPLYDVDEVVLTYTPDATSPVDDALPGVDRLTPTELRVPLPDVGSPALATTSFGLLWVVAHDDGSVSVLPAVVDAPVDEDTGVTDIGRIVMVADDGASFAAAGFTWDAHGRAINGGRANDLVGFAGLTDGDEVEVFFSDAEQIAGTPTPPAGASADYMTPTDAALTALWREPIDTTTFLTLSSAGPVWRWLDASLVVKGGVGAICEIDESVPVPDLATCHDDDSGAIKTTITSSDPDITTWYHSPILAWQDPMAGAFTMVVPLGGTSSRNDAPPDTVDVAVTDVAFSCRAEVGLTIAVRVEASEAVRFEYSVTDGSEELGSATGSMAAAGWLEVGTVLLRPPGPDAQLLVSHGSTDLEIQLDTEDLPDCGA